MVQFLAPPFNLMLVVRKKVAAAVDNLRLYSPSLKLLKIKKMELIDAISW